MPLIIFDIDGTLVDSQHHIVEAQGRAFAAHGIPAPSRKDSLSVVGLSLPEAFAVLAGPGGPAESLSEAYKDAWTEMRQRPHYEETLYPGAGDLIADLTRRPDVRLGIATGKSRRGVDRLLAAQNWDGLFETIQTADDHPSKPHPSMILKALEETGVASGDATMIGDTSYDMAMARDAGVAAIGVAWGYHEPDMLIEAGAVAVVEDFAALRAKLGFEGYGSASRDKVPR